MDDKKIALIIIVVAGGIVLLVGGFLTLMYLGDKWQHKDEEIPSGQNTWFNGSRYINNTEGWAYIDLTFPGELAGMTWKVSVNGIKSGNRFSIYTMESHVNSSRNGVRLNLEHERIRQFGCFEVMVTVGDEKQTETVCLDELEVR